MDSRLITRNPNNLIPLSRLICNGNSSFAKSSASFDQEAKIRNLGTTFNHFTRLLLISLFTTLCCLIMTLPFAQGAEGVTKMADFESTIILTSHCEFSVADRQLADLIKFYQKSDPSLRSALKWVRCEGYNSGPSLLFDYGNVDPLFARESPELQYKAIEESFKKPTAIKVIPNAVISLSTLGNPEDCKDKACLATANIRELMITF